MAKRTFATQNNVKPSLGEKGLSQPRLDSKCSL